MAAQRTGDPRRRPLCLQRSCRIGRRPQWSKVSLPFDPLDDIGRDHSAADELLQVARDALVRIEAFCRDRDVIGLAEEPLEIEWTPLFLRGWAQAMLSSPGPFEAGEKAYFHITPIPAEWSDDARDSYLREMNRHQLEVLTIHEAVPGHYLQGVYGNRVRSPLRAALGHGAYAEGWAVYVTQVMIDLGYGADDPALRQVCRYAHRYGRLRRVVRGRFAGRPGR